MTATCIHLTDTEATVVLRPCWLARLFGARVVSVDLRKLGFHWLTTTGEPMLRIYSFPGYRDNAILDAVDYRIVAQLPEARAL